MMLATFAQTTTVIPAKAGIPLAFDVAKNSGTPAFAGVTKLGES